MDMKQNSAHKGRRWVWKELGDAFWNLFGLDPSSSVTHFLVWNPMGFFDYEWKGASHHDEWKNGSWGIIKIFGTWYDPRWSEDISDGWRFFIPVTLWAVLPVAVSKYQILSDSNFAFDTYSPIISIGSRYFCGSFLFIEIIQ